MKIKNYIKQVPLLTLLVLWYTCAWSWTFFTDSLDLAGSKPQAMAIAVLVVIFNVAISVGIVAWAFRYLKKRFINLNSLQVILLGLPLFALMDFAISWLTAIIWIGPQGSVDNVLPLSSPTLILINTPFRFVARVVGFYGLAAFFWLIVFLLIDKNRRNYGLIMVGVLAGLSLLSWGVYKTPHGTDFKATIISENLDDHVPPVKSGNADIVIFPEYSMDEVNNSNLQTRFEKNPQGPKTTFLGTQEVHTDAPTGHYNILLFGNSESGITNLQSKHRLIPGGEDLPYVVRVLLRATNQRGTLDYFSYAKMVIKGPHPLQPYKASDTITLGSAVCSSIISPKDYQTFASQGANVFTNSASLTIFKGSKIFAWQQKSLARFMAVSNSRYFLQSANAASAYTLDNNGKQIAEVRGISSTDVVAKTNSKKTLYTYVGEYLVAIGLLIVFVWLVQFMRQRNKPTMHKSKVVVKKKSPRSSK